jgi:serine/threonine protein kinase
MVKSFLKKLIFIDFRYKKIKYMETIIVKYLIENLAPRLSQRFNLELSEVVHEMENFAVNPPKTRFRPGPGKPGKYDNLTLKTTPVVKRDHYNFMTVEEMKVIAHERKIIIPARIKKSDLEKALGDYDVLASKVELPDEKLKFSDFNKLVTIYCSREELNQNQIVVIDQQKREKTVDIVKSFSDFTNKTIFGFNNPNTKWNIGVKQGSGGFGVIYSINENTEQIIKIEKKQPGVALFMEIHVYREMKKLRAQNILEIIDSGLYKHNNNEDYYFLVLPRCEFTLKHHIEISKNKMTTPEIGKLLIDIISALKYIHMYYLHLDVKPANIMWHNNNWYLIDLGLAKKYKREEESTYDKKYAGNGTASYMSINAHDGCMNRRCDLESLIYILFETLSIELPWRAKPILNKNDIKESKKRMLTIFNTFSIPSKFIHFIRNVLSIKPDTDINYENIQKQLS